MALDPVPLRARIRWIRLRIPLQPSPSRYVQVAGRGGQSAHWPRYKLGRNRRPVLLEQAAERRRERQLRMQREQLIHLARVSLLGELSAALVHELNQPLAAILANAQAGRRRLEQPAHLQRALADILNDIVEASQRAVTVIQHMRGLFLRRDTQRQPLDLNAVARDAVALARSTLARHGVRLALALDPRAVLLRGDAVQLEQVVLNLVLNACDAMNATPRDARRLVVTTSGNAGAEARLTVTDNGAGIAAGLLERIFDSFFTTKPNGLGVGLSVSRDIVAAHGGRIEAANRSEGGAVFRVTLPKAGERHHE